MDEGNTNITKMLETLLAKIDDQKMAHEKQIELQAAFNAQISQEMRGLSRQLDLTQADLDLTRKTAEGSSPSGSVTTHIHQPAQPQQQPPPPPPPILIRKVYVVLVLSRTHFPCFIYVLP